MRAIQQFFSNDDGTTAVEYAVMLALILMTCIVAIKTVGSSTSGIWANNQSELNSVGF